MLRTVARISCCFPVKSIHTSSGLSPKTLTLINASDSRVERIQAAIGQNLYALATLIALNKPLEPLSMTIQQQIVRGLMQYHPRLTPINLMALIRFHKQMKFDIESIDKAFLMKSLITYGDHQLIRSGLDLIGRAGGGPIPNNSIMALVGYAKDRHAVESCVYLWEYMAQTYPLTLADYSATMVDLMEVFSRSRRYSHLAGHVARACLVNASNPSIALSIAKVCYKLQDDKLMQLLTNSPGFRMSREIEGVRVQMDARRNSSGFLKQQQDPTSEKPSAQDLSAQELSGVVKAVAENDIEAAEKLVDENPHENNRYHLLAQIALCNQYIREGSLTKFNEAFWTIRQLKGINGILLNLKLTWELYHGNFMHAKRHYQNIQNVPAKQRAIALNTLSVLAKEEPEKEWVSSERRILERSL